MDIFEALFLFQLLVIFGITFLKLYNVMNMGQAYDLKFIWLGLIAYLFFWLMGMLVVMTNVEEVLYMTIFKLESWLLALNVIFLIVELIMQLRGQIQTAVQPYMSNANK